MPAAPSGLPRVLLVEDDADVRETTTLILRRDGFAVEAAADAESGYRLVEAGGVDVAVIDITLPGADGLELAARIRAGGTLPILLLTARDTPKDIVAGFDAGADDYVTKPFDGSVLTARITALLRRVSPPTRAVTRVGGLRIDHDARTVTRRGVPIPATPTEFRLVEALAEKAGAAASRRELLLAVWGDDHWIDERVVNTNIQRLRVKLGDETIVTVRGFGYRLASGGEDPRQEA